MSAKPTEEGLFWEWRTFGALPDRVARTLARCEVRGAPDMVNEDLYFVSRLTGQNVKLRKHVDQLKLKPLLARLDDGVELYEESARWTYQLPAPPGAVAAAAAFLGLGLEASEPWSAERLRAAFKVRGGVVQAVAVRKRRTQYSLGGGWAELADLDFPSVSVRTLGLQSPSLAETRRMRDLLDPDRSLAAVNYVEACRRWGA